jgi:hypothetical protein
MGHERVGQLPRTTRWRELVARTGAAQSRGDVERIAADTIDAVRGRLGALGREGGTQAAFGFLVELACASRDPESAAPDLRANPSALQLVSALKERVDAGADSREYAELATRAAATAIMQWTREHEQHLDLFEGPASAQQVWSRAQTGAGFSELARVFLGDVVGRYLKYFLEREVSERSSGVAQREQFVRQLSEHVDAITKHSFETSKIAQSFAAGWYNKHAKEGAPSAPAQRAFLRYALTKLRNELARERDA